MHDPIKIIGVVILVIGMLAAGIYLLNQTTVSSDKVITNFDTKANEILGSSGS